MDSRGYDACRSVIMTAKANKKYLSFQAGEHLKPEIIKIKPQQTVPTLLESRAVQVYLVEK